MRQKSLSSLMPLYIILAFFTLFSPAPSKACNTSSAISGSQLGKNQFVWVCYSPKSRLRLDWDFGDGQSSAGKIAKTIYHTYTTKGKYTITAYLWDSSSNCADTLTVAACYFTFDSIPVFRRSGDTLKASVACLPNLKYKWSFGDNSTGEGCNISHIYAVPGFYRASLVKVWDTLTGCSDTPYMGSSVMDFTPCGFYPKFFVNGTYAGTSQADVYSYPFDQFYFPKISGTSEWIWGDGKKTKQNFIGYFETQSHKYANAGTYTVCHIMTDSTGNCQDSVCHPFKVDSCTTVPDFSYTVSGNNVQFTNLSNTVKIGWSFGSGIGDSTVINGKAEFPGSGSYTVCLTATLNGCIRKICKTITITSCPRINNMNMSWDNWDCYKAIFNYKDSAYKQFTWYFGDSSTPSNDMSPVHKYPGRGLYNTKLVVEDTSAKCKDSLTFPHYCNCIFCGIRDSLVLEYDTMQPYEATLNNYTYNTNSSGVIHKHFWDFGDGDTSWLASPIHTYNTTGSIYIRYIAYDTIAPCNDTTWFRIFIDSAGNVKRKVFVLNVKYHGSETGIDQASVLGFQFYPNPFSNKLELSGDMLDNITGISMFSILGQEIPLTYKIQNTTCQVLVSDDLPNGMYLLQVKTDFGHEWLKVLKNN